MTLLAPQCGRMAVTAAPPLDICEHRKVPESDTAPLPPFLKCSLFLAIFCYQSYPKVDFV